MDRLRQFDTIPITNVCTPQSCASGRLERPQMGCSRSPYQHFQAQEAFSSPFARIRTQQSELAPLIVPGTKNSSAACEETSGELQRRTGTGSSCCKFTGNFGCSVGTVLCSASPTLVHAVLIIWFYFLDLILKLFVLPRNKDYN